MQQSTIEMWTIAISGITTVFVCLIALVAMVSIFKLIFVGKEKKAGAPSGAAELPQARPALAAGGIDPAVVAAIVAAIAASSGVAASSIRIASIERSGFNTPVWGYVDRVNQVSSFGRS